MIKFENTEIIGWKAALRGMRNPLNSWEKTDTVYKGIVNVADIEIVPGVSTPVQIKGKLDVPDIGPNDHTLMMKLRTAGTDHRKFMRMIVVYVDITAPLYWWKEFDTYKVGTVANSCSTMHTILDKEFTLGDFSCEHLTDQCKDILKEVIHILNIHRTMYAYNNDKRVGRYNVMTDECYKKYKKELWWQMIQLLPSSYNQKRTVMMNYEVLANIYKSRKNHKLDEWRMLCNEWIPTLPYPELITGEEKGSQN